MSCDEHEPEHPDLEPQVETLFAVLEDAGTTRLHPIERDIVEALRLRPRRTWCHAQLRLLAGLVLKARGDVAGLDRLVRTP